jgi:hypothetical protein
MRKDVSPPPQTTGSIDASFSDRFFRLTDEMPALRVHLPFQYVPLPPEQRGYTIKKSRRDDNCSSYVVEHPSNGRFGESGLIRSSFVMLDENYTSSDLKGLFSNGSFGCLVETFLPDGTPCHGNIASKKAIASDMLYTVAVEALEKKCDFIAFRENHPQIQQFLWERGFDRYVEKDEKGEPVPTSLFYMRL